MTVNSYAYFPGPEGPMKVKLVDTGEVAADGKAIYALDMAAGIDQSTPGVTNGVQINAGEAHIGNFGGVAIVKTVEFSRPADTTAYTVKDAVNVNLACSDATNASPIVVTTPTHGLADGDVVTISGITGNTNANGTFYAKVTGYTTLTFALYSDKALTTPVAGNGAYGGTGLVARLWTLRNFFRVAGGSGYITKIRMLTNLVTDINSFRLHFYASPIAAQLDNVLFTLLWANRAARLGYVNMPAMTTEGSGSDSAHSLVTSGDGISGLPMLVYNGDTIPGRDLYMRVEITTPTPAAPASGQTFFIEVTDDAN
jgi:hypothetical protein